MKKLFYFLINIIKTSVHLTTFAVLLVLFCTISCTDKMVDPPSTTMVSKDYMEEDLTPSSAQIWFEKKYGNKNAKLTASTKTPLWTYATQTKDKDGNTMILAPIATGESQQNFGVILNDIEKEKKAIKDKKLDESNYAVPQKLLMIKDKKGKIQIFLAKIVADYEYFNKLLYKNKKSQAKNDGSDFDGSVILYNWGQDQIVEAFRYKNGKLKGNLASLELAKNARVSACEVVGYTQYFPCNNARTSSDQTSCGTFLYIGYNCTYDGSSTVISTPTFFIEGGGGGYSSDIISSSYRASAVDNFIGQASQYGVTFNPDERLDFIDNFDEFLKVKDQLLNAIRAWGNMAIQYLEQKFNETFLRSITLQERNHLSNHGFIGSYRVNLMMYLWNADRAKRIAVIGMNTLKTPNNSIDGNIGGDCGECRGNAIKHAAWVILNAQTFNPWLAEQLGIAHETGQPGGPASMDLHNNGIGLTLYNNFGIAAIQELVNVLQNGLPWNANDGFRFILYTNNNGNTIGENKWTKDYPNEN